MAYLARAVPSLEGRRRACASAIITQRLSSLLTLSLHYGRPSACLALPHPCVLCWYIHTATARTLLTLVEPGRPRFVGVRMAGSRPPGPVRRLCDADMVEPRD